MRHLLGVDDLDATTGLLAPTYAPVERGADHAILTRRTSGAAD